MKTLKVLLILTCMSSHMFGQTNLYSTDFTSSSGWSLGFANNFDTWVINGNYNCSTPTPNSGGGNYLHITDDLGGETCAYAGFYGLGSSGACYASMNSGFSTVDLTEVVISFDWLCRGQTGSLLPSYGMLEYNTEGSTWIRITTPVNNFSGQTSWTTCTISSNAVPGLLNKPNLKLRFGWVSSGYGSNPAFAIDNLQITGIAGCANSGGTSSAINSSICAGQSTELNLSGYTGAIQWQDSISDGTWANVSGGTAAQYITVALDSTTLYRAVLSQTDCPDQYSTITEVKVSPLVSPEVTVNADILNGICMGQAVTFEAEGIHAGTTPQYTWRLNGVQIGLDSIIYSTDSLSDGDEVHVTLFSSEVCADSNQVESDTYVINVFELPEVQLNVPEIICSGDEILALTFGSPDGGTYTGNGINENKFDLSQPEGEYILLYSYTDGNGCTNAVSDTFNLTLCTTIADFESNPIINFFPNPSTDGNINIQSELPIQSLDIIIADGRHVLMGMSINDNKINLSGLEKGIYFIRVNSLGKMHMVKLILQ